MVASALGLLVENEKTLPQYGSLIQNFNRWLLSTFSTEAIVEGWNADIKPKDIANLSLRPAAKPSVIDQVLGIELKTTNTCQSCGFVATRHGTLQAVDLAYPRKPAEAPSFPELLRSSIIRETSTRAACSNCKQFAPLLSQRVLADPSSKGLPPVISVNAMISGPEVFEVWKDKRKAGETVQYLPSRVGFKMTESGDMEIDDTGVVYEVKVGWSRNGSSVSVSDDRLWLCRCRHRLKRPRTCCLSLKVRKSRMMLWQRTG